MKHVLRWMNVVRLALRDAGPYLALLVLPGGSVLAAAAWLLRHWPSAKARP
jgi:hypothetical protein